MSARSKAAWPSRANTLDLDQVTALLDGKRVIGQKEEIQEALNAIATYDSMAEFDPFSTESLLEAHRIMMDQLIPSPGKWRSSNVGILKGSEVSHIAPKADRVPHLMDDHFRFLQIEGSNPLIHSCVFHYELEFLDTFTVPSTGTVEAKQAFDFLAGDFEDALQISAAIASKADHILTNDISGFSNPPISVLSPKDFLLL
ncbi:Fic family protein [Luteolibacter sp. AS25]|uniref:Fic family protein n=1 Tax=Luteolibacter sp. AS25 TaxID=3135776 RepID=UPI00398A998C